MQFRYLRRILVHNGKILRVSLPLDFCRRAEWRVGDQLQLDGETSTGALTLTRIVKPTRRRFSK